MEITRSAFERSPGDSQQIGNEQILTLNTPAGVFASLRARLIIPYFILTMLSAIVGVCLTTRLVTSSLYEPFVNQLLDASRIAGRASWPQSLPAAALAHENGWAEARNNTPHNDQDDVRFRVEHSIGWALA
jgi:hypothetical protein